MHEPDKVHWIDPVTDLDCLVVRNHWGSLCGYVGVPPGHPLHGVHEEELEVHGGITFSGPCMEGEGPVCHVPLEGRPADVWWLGFDCGHAWDIKPGMHAWEKSLGLPPLLHGGYFPQETYKTISYVAGEIEGLALQLTQQQGKAAMSTPRNEPGIGDISAVVPAGVEKEPMLLIDTTGSMTYPNAPDSQTTRRGVLGEAIETIVAKLGAEDSQAAGEAARGEDAGGLMTITFADGKAQNIGDLSPSNVRQKWDAIQWGGDTFIQPGWELLVKTYQDEFPVGSENRPQMLGLIVTDGEAKDTDQFAQAISQAKDLSHVVIALLGFGEQHDRAKKVYEDIAARNDHVRVVTFTGQTDPNVIANSVISMLA